MATQEEQKHPANAVFLLLEDRQFRFDVVKPGLAKEKHRLGQLVTGKHQVKGFRTLSKAPASMLLPVIAEEASVAPELARALLTHWYEANSELKAIVAVKLKEYGYEPVEESFDEEGNISWKLMSADHANEQFAGEFLPGEDENSVMLMSLMLGWFGTDEEDPRNAADADEPTSAKKKAGPADITAEKPPKPEAALSASKSAPPKDPTPTKPKSDHLKGTTPMAEQSTTEKKTAPKKTAAKKSESKKSEAKPKPKK